MEQKLFVTSCESGGSSLAAARSWRQGLFLTLCTVALLVPFLDKPFHIDDPLFVWAAKNIQKKPLDFFGFEVNWNGFIQQMHEVTQNPPLASYYLAAAATLTRSWDERWLHAACLLPAIGAVLGTWILASRLCRRPLLAGMVAVCSPVFLVSGTNVMCDMLMTGLWMGAVILWCWGLEQDNPWRLAAAAVLISAASLTKYFGLCLLPLLGLYTLVRQGRLDPRLLWLLIPVACLTGYEAWTDHLYGHGLVSGASQFVRSRYFGKSPDPFAKGIAAFAFTGGCLVCFPFFLPRLLRQHWRWLILLAAIPVLTFLFHSWNPISLQPGKIRPTTWDIAFQVALLVVLGVGVLLLTLEDAWCSWEESRGAAPDVRRRLLANSLLLASWVSGTMIFAGYVNWTVNGRSVLPLVPAAAILLCRALDRVPFSPVASTSASSWIGRLRAGLAIRLWSKASSPWPVLLLIPAAVVSLLIVHADYRFASTQRSAAEKLMSISRPPRSLMWFSGHWGFQYYMEQLGGVALVYPSDPLEPGDLFAQPLNNDNQYSPPEGSEWINVLKFELSLWAATNVPARCAGFYNSEGGTLPFAIGPEWESDPQHAAAVRANSQDIYNLTRITKQVTVLPNWMISPASSPRDQSR